MDTDLKCNRLTCRRVLEDKAVVTTCSHIFCVECANELFNAARMCPACETSLLEPDDVVVCSLHPSNDYKTSVLSGLSPSIILEICSRAVSFWQYQIHQENSFQVAVVRNVNDKNAQLQKQIENVVREANGELGILSNKVAELQRDLELERRKIRDLQEASRERDKEYQKLKTQHDKIKRKALLAPNNNAAGQEGIVNFDQAHQAPETQHPKLRTFGGSGGNVNFGAVVEGMEANRIQRTPIVNRTGGTFAPHQTAWNQPQSVNQQGPAAPRLKLQKQNFGQADRSHRSGTASDRSDSAGEVENMLMSGSGRVNNQGGWTAVPTQRAYPGQRVFAPPPTKRSSGGFRPAIVPRQ